VRDSVSLPPPLLPTHARSSRGMLLPRCLRLDGVWRRIAGSQTNSPAIWIMTSCDDANGNDTRGVSSTNLPDSNANDADVCARRLQARGGGVGSWQPQHGHWTAWATTDGAAARAADGGANVHGHYAATHGSGTQLATGPSHAAGSGRRHGGDVQVWLGACVGCSQSKWTQLLSDLRRVRDASTDTRIVGAGRYKA
jgi:hypothetical protein